MRVAFLGPLGTYSHQAVLQYFASTPASSLDLIPLSHITTVFQHLQTYPDTTGIVPYHNTIVGTITETQQALETYPHIQIQGRLSLPIRHCLLSVDPTLGSIHSVYSHPEALGQCTRWLDTHLPDAQRLQVSSTAQAAEMAARRNGTAAIASRVCVELFPQLKCLVEGIQDVEENYTEFVVLEVKDMASFVVQSGT